MASPASASWWSTFLNEQGADSEEQAAFEGYLVTQGIAAESEPDALEQAYAAFHVFMAESGEREADRGPTRAELAAQQAVAALEQEFVAKSRGSAPGVEKPLTAATRPKETRQPLAETTSAPSGEAPSAPTPEPAAHETESRGSRGGRLHGSSGDT